MATIVLKARAKVNLALDVTGIRADGYHEMKMINHSVDLEDQLIFEPCDDEVLLTSNGRSIPLDERNLVMKVVRKIQSQFNITKGIKIHLEKKIPAQAGLAGGSSDAAATLKGLNQLWGLNLSTAELIEIGVTIGADIPYCLVGGTALVEGIGEKITPLQELDKMFVLVVKPDIDIATPWAFKKLDELTITKHPDITALIEVLNNADYERLHDVIGNVFENVAFACYPEIAALKKALLSQGALAAVMTGSGSTVVGYYRNYKLAKRSWERCSDKYKLCFLTQTCEKEGVDDVE